MARLTTNEAAKRLGVKPASIYAYVSRGHLASSPSPDGRHSTFSASDIEALARRGRPRQASRSHALDFTIDTAITAITQRTLSYRGRDATSLATIATFEQVADLLTKGSLTEHELWPVRKVEVPTVSSVFDHVALITTLVGAADPLRNDLSCGSVAHIVRTLIASVVDSWPVPGDGRVPRLSVGGVVHRSTIAGRLWTRLSPRRPPAGYVEILNAALVLLADHELAVSTVAARVTASTRADPYAVTSAGVAAVSGSLHGGASRPARRMLDQALRHFRTDNARISSERAASEALAVNGVYPGFGHKVYKHGDPRAEALLRMLREVSGGSREMSVVDALLSSIRTRRDVLPNVDFALAAFGLVAGLFEDSGQAIFSVARIAGWSAHAIEEYGEAPLRFRARAVYIG